MSFFNQLLPESIDNTAANNVKFKCRRFGGGVTTPLVTSGGIWGQYSSECADGSAICGVKVRYQALQGQNGDDTALNDMKFYWLHRLNQNVFCVTVVFTFDNFNK